MFAGDFIHGLIPWCTLQLNSLISGNYLKIYHADYVTYLVPLQCLVWVNIFILLYAI
jgi:hypothetical protein